MISGTNDTVLDQLTRVLVERFSPERIILFGSRGRGDHRPDSDYDLIIVMAQPGRGGDLRPIFAAIRDIHAAVDLVVDTPEEFERRRDDVGTMEYVGARQGRVVYERAGGRPVHRVREERQGPAESLAEWLLRASSDFEMMEVGLLSAPNARDAIAFHAHQGAEKMLKAGLVARDVQPPRTHVLAELLRLSSSDLRDDPTLREACAELDGVWSTTRYPDNPMPTPEQVARAVACATRIRDVVRAAASI